MKNVKRLISANIMTKVNLTKPLIAATVASAMLVGDALAASHSKTDMVELSKELQIMTSIMKTSLQQSNTRQGIRFRGIDVTYLADQGVMFEVNTSKTGIHIDVAGLIGDIPGLIGDIEVPPMPDMPLEFVTSDNEVIINIQNDWEEMAEDALEDARDALRESRDKLRRLREREREYTWEQREYERRKRDLAFQKRNADKESLKNIEEVEKELLQEMEELKAKREEVARYADEIEQEQAKANAKRQAAALKRYKQFLSGFEDNVADVLCKYGAGLKALPKDENVSFVLPNFGQAENEHSRQDRIYVFKQQDIQGCVTGKLSANELLTKAHIYAF